MVSRTHLLGTLAIAGMFITAPVHAVQLHEAAKEGDVEQVKRLIAQGVDVEAKDNKGMTPLGHAVWEGHADIVSLLLSSGANVERALLSASFQGHIEIVRLLLSSGTDVEAKYNNGRTALMLAALQGHREIVRLLLSSGADVEAKNNNGWTALMQAASRGHGEIVRLLLSGGADVEAKNDNGGTALIYASFQGRGEIVRLLLSRGTDVEAKYNNGRTALMLAALQGHREIVTLLLSSGANVNAEANDGRRALEFAKTRGHQDIVAVLLNNNADTTETPGMKCSVLAGRLLAGSARGAVLLYEDKFGYFAGRDDEGRFLIVSEFFLAGERWSRPFVANSSTEIVDAAGNAAQLPNGPTGVCVPIRFWATGERLDRVVVLDTPPSPSESKDSADASGSVPSARPDAAGTQDGCYQSFELAYPDRSQLPPYHRVQELDVRPDRQSGPLPQYPEGLRSEGITGTVELAFLILPNGKADYPVVSRMSHPGLAIRRGTSSSAHGSDRASWPAGRWRLWRA